jgi:DNA polymerase III subunit epsilon
MRWLGKRAAANDPERGELGAGGPIESQRPLKIELRLEVEEDGRVVSSRPILRTALLFAPSQPLRDLSLDLEVGRRLKPGGFVALDFETATNSRASACAVALAAVDGGRVTDVERWLIRPPGNDYDPFFIGIHGITPEHTANSPSIDAVWPEVSQWIKDRPIVAHYAPFDLSVLRHSLSGAEQDWPELTYYCTCALSRRAWPGRLSYRLPDLASECDLTFEHHEPGADAATAAELAVACCGATNSKTLRDASEALGMVAGRLTAGSWTPNGLAPVRLNDLTASAGAVPEGSAFIDRTAVFTGTLSCGLTRREAAQLVVNAGGAVAAAVSKKVDYLVLGMQDAYKVKDGEHSTKMLRAAELRAAGAPIELLDEEEFLRMLPA